MNGHARESEIVNHSPPLHARLTKVDQQREDVVVGAGLSRRFPELTVFDARLYVRVRRSDEPA